jgi:hypothetical protein
MIRVSVEDDAPPLVRAVAHDVAARLEDPSFAAATEGIQGAVVLRSVTSAQAVTLRIGEDGISIQHGADEDADLSAGIDFADPDGSTPELEGHVEHPDLAGWLRELLDTTAPSWQEAADRFWSVLEDMAGAPAALVVVDLDGGERRRYGRQDGRAYELHAHAETLTEVFTGRVPPIDAGFEGKLFVVGSFPELSVLSGAGFAVRYGGPERHA